MNIWKCGTHGITGPNGCCEEAERFDSADGVEWTLAATPPTPDLDAVRPADRGEREDIVTAVCRELDVQDYDWVANCISAYQKLSAVSRPAEGKPVAWRIEFPDGKLLFTHYDPTEYRSYSTVRIIPLYTRPTPQAAPEVTGETRDEIASWCEELVHTADFAAELPPFYAYADNEAACRMADDIKRLRDDVRETCYRITAALSAGGTDGR